MASLGRQSVLDVEDDGRVYRGLLGDVQLRGVAELPSVSQHRWSRRRSRARSRSRSRSKIIGRLERSRSSDSE